MRILVALAFCAVLGAQQRGVYTHARTTAGTSEKVTLHLPTASSNRTVRLVGVMVYCATACTAPLSRDGTAPTVTAATATKLNASAATPAVVPYNASDVGSGTAIKTYRISAGQDLVIDLSQKTMLPGNNITIAPSISGAEVLWMWGEN